MWINNTQPTWEDIKHRINELCKLYGHWNTFHTIKKASIQGGRRCYCFLRRRSVHTEKVKGSNLYLSLILNIFSMMTIKYFVNSEGVSIIIKLYLITRPTPLISFFVREEVCPQKHGAGIYGFLKGDFIRKVINTQSVMLKIQTINNTDNELEINFMNRHNTYQPTHSSIPH